MKVWRREQIRAGREQLPHLDERRPELLEIRWQLRRIRGARRQLLVLPGYRVFESRPRDQIRSPVLVKDPRDLFVSSQALRPQR